MEKDGTDMQVDSVFLVDKAERATSNKRHRDCQAGRECNIIMSM